MPTPGVQPLRIQKNTPSSSPTKMANGPVSRPLSELSPMAQRRNSPSFNQTSKQTAFNEDSSPFDMSPFNVSDSPRLFWQGRDPISPGRFSSENTTSSMHRDSSPSPKRSSIENLKRASRVKNSNMFAREHKQEYDPTSAPLIERPLASGRPLTVQAQGNAYGGRGLDGLRDNKTAPNGHGTGSKVPIYSPSASPSKNQVSPTKSSLSNQTRFSGIARPSNPENDMWAEDDEPSEDCQLPPGRVLHRHAKSVTFDEAPPQINEYEMTTPDLSSVASGSRDGSYDSVDEYEENEESFDRGSSTDRDGSFDASLEDIAKTPVVEPEDWRHMSPDVANGGLASRVADPFEDEGNSPQPAARANQSLGQRLTPTRTDSLNSNGERRPLPPLPGNMGVSQPYVDHEDSRPSLTASVRDSSLQCTIGSASVSKAEIKSIGGVQLSLEDRLRLMMVQDKDQSQPPEIEQDIFYSCSSPYNESQILPDQHEAGTVHIHEDGAENDDVGALGDYQLPPRISRESILRKVKSQHQYTEETDYSYSSPGPGSSPERDALANLDPDVPLPSLEQGPQTEEAETSVIVKQEIEEDGTQSEIDVYSIPEMYNIRPHAGFLMDELEGDESVIRHDIDLRKSEDDDVESSYSQQSADHDQPQSLSAHVSSEEGLLTPRPPSANDAQLPTAVPEASNRMSLPEFASLLGEDDFGFGLQSYMTPSPPAATEVGVPEPAKALPLSSLETEHSQEAIQRPITPVEQLLPPMFPNQDSTNQSTPRTPDSVIRHPIQPESPAPESPSVPEPVATVKAPGGRLKTRPSATPADIRAMASARRQVSGETPMVPPVPERHRERPSLSSESSSTSTESYEDTKGAFESIAVEPKRVSSLVKLDMPVGGVGDDLGFGMDKEFDRVIETQKRGYLMRQNTKVIVASSNNDEFESGTRDTENNLSHGTRSAGSSPRKASHERGHTWTTEPWNGKVRRKSVRQSAGSPQKRPSSGPAPPLPGKESNVTGGLGSVAENAPTSANDEVGDGGEKGRLFVKVVGVKDLDLPLPKGERTWFCLTLDNGLHCVTTSYLELGKNAPIGQEFELVVLNDLEFQLTLQTKIEPPAPAQAVVESPTKAAKTPKQSAFSRVFASPKKRKELERKQQEEEQRIAHQKQNDAQAKRQSTQPTAWDLLHPLVAQDGSFARAYFCLKDHERRSYGRPYNVDITCFNEWATEEINNASSVKSKRGANAPGTQRRAPYRIGKLELQLLFVPKPKGATDAEMPKSMTGCLREMKEAEARATRSYEGHLSQQGGDCPFWRRRFFKLEGAKLTAYHETTRQPRATINLAKASKLIDDRSSLVQKEVSAKGGSRRKSAFAEEEEGYMFVEEGFRVRFANGETIDFYADNAEQKEGWMKVLADTVGKEAAVKGWTDMVLAKERAERSKTDAAPATQGRKRVPSTTTKSVPATPSKHVAPPPVSKSPRHSVQQQPKERGAKTRSMIF
ncbi:MAG: Bud site selection protein bud4 [Candelina submexicana]|nr:MAG: Bud site selection protein bud4 [Candelina submexicana]